MTRHQYVLRAQGGTHVETYRFSSKMDLATLLFTLNDDGFLVIEHEGQRCGFPAHSVVVIQLIEGETA
jgi:hypothetical protein